MKKLNSLARVVANKYNAAGALVASMVLSQAAFADGLDTTAITAEAASGKTNLYAIGGIVLGLCAVGMVIAFARRTAK